MKKEIIVTLLLIAVVGSFVVWKISQKNGVLISEPSKTQIKKPQPIISPPAASPATTSQKIISSPSTASSTSTNQPVKNSKTTPPEPAPQDFSSPEDLAKEMTAAYPKSWITYHGSDFSIQYPPTLVINSVDNGILASVPDEKMELEPGSSYPLHFSIKIFKPSEYRSTPVEDYIKSDGSYLTPETSDRSCGNIKTKQETYDTAGPEFGQGKIHRLTFLRNQKLYEFEFGYGWSGECLSAPSCRAREEAFIANNEKLGCNVLSSLQFLK